MSDVVPDVRSMARGYPRYGEEARARGSAMQKVRVSYQVDTTRLPQVVSLDAVRNKTKLNCYRDMATWYRVCT